MTLPSPDTPLYNHPLPAIEQWLEVQGCQQSPHDLHCWIVKKRGWQAEIILDVDQLVVSYVGAGQQGQDIKRAFKYSLSRQDIEDAVFSGP